MQRLTLIFFCASLALMSASVSANRDLIVGNHVYGDYLLEQKEVDVGSILWKVREKTVTLKGDGIAKISRIEIYDLKGNSHPATPSISSGGPGYSFVTIKFVSDRGHGIHFLVKIYGK